MKLSISYTLVPDQIPEQEFNSLLQELPQDQQDKIRCYKKNTDAYKGLFGKLLLMKQLNETNLKLSDIKYNEYNRPYLEGNNVDFNISHSGKCVICAFCEDGKLGVDVEEVKPVELQYFEDQWTEAESKKVNASTFHHFWTRKEAVVKANGKGLGIPLNEFSVELDKDRTQLKREKQTWFLHQIEMQEAKEYVSHLAIDKEITTADIKPTHIPSKELISGRNLIN